MEFRYIHLMTEETFFQLCESKVLLWLLVKVNVLEKAARGIAPKGRCSRHPQQRCDKVKKTEQDGVVELIRTLSFVENIKKLHYYHHMKQVSRR